MNSKIKPKIISLKEKGFTYREIAEQLNCSVGAVHYNVNYEKIKTNKTKGKRKFIRPKKGYPPDHARNRMLKWRYDLEIEEYQKLYEKQDNKCAICKGSFELGGMKGLYVDHDHVTNKVRGLLCPACNSALGKFKDSVEILQNAIKYLTIA